jgi:hypothetical protein
VPDGQNPQQFNRFSFVTNNPLKYTDPTGYCGEGSTPGEDVSQEHHDLLCKLHDEALRLSELVRNGELTDVEALAMLMDFAAPSYQYPAWSDTRGFVFDLGIVVGGLEIRGNILQHGLNLVLGRFHPEDAFRLIADPSDPTANANDPLGQYYIGYNNFRAEPTGFAWQYADPGENQVRHFIGGLASGYAFAGGGRSYVLQQEQAQSGLNSPDYQLHLKAFELADHLAVNKAGNWALRNLATWQVRHEYGLAPRGW